MAEAGTYGGCCGCPDVLPLGVYVYEQHRVCAGNEQVNIFPLSYNYIRYRK